MNDLKFALRQLLKNPDFTVRPSQCCCGGQAVAVLTLGIGANTAFPSLHHSPKVARKARLTSDKSARCPIFSAMA